MQYRRKYLSLTKGNSVFKEWWGKSDSITTQIYQPDSIIDQRCNNWACSYCRPGKITALHMDIVHNILRDDIINEHSMEPLQNHWIWTFPGNEVRKKVTYEESYRITSHEFHNLIKRFMYEFERYRQGKNVRNRIPLLMVYDKNSMDYIEYNPTHNTSDFAYITLSRSQNHPYRADNLPGYDHLHNITNLMPNEAWLNDIIQRNGYIVGYQMIKENKNVAEYLANDFFDDEEFVIPLKQRHCNYSRNLTMHIDDTKLPDGSIVLNRHRTLQNQINTIQKMQNRPKTIRILNEEFRYNNPEPILFNEILSEFYQKKVPVTEEDSKSLLTDLNKAFMPFKDKDYTPEYQEFYKYKVQPLVINVIEEQELPEQIRR